MLLLLQFAFFSHVFCFPHFSFQAFLLSGIKPNTEDDGVTLAHAKEIVVALPAARAT